jgi:alkyl hydroperoxide reductase subunit F
VEKLHDLIIIGAGPAGITASIYAARKRMNFIVITEDIGGQTAWSGDIENYTGFQMITGSDLVKKFEDHVKEYNVPLNENEKVIEVRKEGNFAIVDTVKGSYKSKTVVIASGKRSKDLNVPGEDEFKNKGLTYCATCDGPLFGGKDVVVIGGGNSALDAALQLEKITNKIYIVNITPELGGDAVMREKVTKSGKVTVMNDSQVVAVLGDKFVNKVKVKTGGEDKEIDVQGVFVEIGLEPNSVFAKDLEKNKKGEIIVNCHNETAVPGVFAAGDVTNVPVKQIIIAAGDGAKAALGAYLYISKRPAKDWEGA